MNLQSQKEFRDLPPSFYLETKERFKNTDSDIKTNPILRGIEYDVAEKKADGKIILNVYQPQCEVCKMEVDKADFEKLEKIINY